MIKMTINKTIKYGKKKIAPNQPFDVADEHIDELRAKGAHVIEGADVEDGPSEDAVIERAEELGIEVGRKGVKTLLKLIGEAEAALEEE